MDSNKPVDKPVAEAEDTEVIENESDFITDDDEDDEEDEEAEEEVDEVDDDK